MTEVTFKIMSTYSPFINPSIHLCYIFTHAELRAGEKSKPIDFLFNVKAEGFFVVIGKSSVLLTAPG